MYHGNWHEDQMHGEGYYKFKNLEYSGNYQYNQKNGFGKLFSKKDGFAFEGQFKDNKKHGEGKMIFFKNGEKVLEFEGLWKDNDFVSELK